MWWNKYIKIPFIEKGRGEKGCDCWGLAQLIYIQEREIVLPGYLELYENTQQREQVAAIIEAERKSKWKDVEAGQEFDIIILRIQGQPMHIGVVTKPNYMIHCTHGIGTVHEQYNSMKWKDRIIGFARYEHTDRQPE